MQVLYFNKVSKRSCWYAVLFCQLALNRDSSHTTPTTDTKNTTSIEWRYLFNNTSTVTKHIRPLSISRHTTDPFLSNTNKHKNPQHGHHDTHSRLGHIGTTTVTASVCVASIEPIRIPIQTETLKSKTHGHDGIRGPYWWDVADAQDPQAPKLRKASLRVVLGRRGFTWESQGAGEHHQNRHQDNGSRKHSSSEKSGSILSVQCDHVCRIIRCGC